jgi:hypothetical protein
MFPPSDVRRKPQAQPRPGSVLYSLSRVSSRNARAQAKTRTAIILWHNIPMSKIPICAATFDNYLDAENYRNTLHAVGIPAEIVGPSSSSGFGLTFGMLSKVSVMVPANAVRRLAQIPPPCSGSVETVWPARPHVSDPPAYLHAKRKPLH